MTAKAKRPIPDEYDRPTSWLRGLKTNPDLREFCEMGLIGPSIEGLIRFYENKGGIEEVDINAQSLANALKLLSECEPEFMVLALQTVAQALFGLDGASRLVVEQESAGKPPPQLPTRLRRLKRDQRIVDTVNEAKARGDRSPNNVAANVHGCELHEVKRAIRAINRLNAQPKD